MTDEKRRKTSVEDPRGYVIAELPDGMDPEAGSAVIRLLAQRRETTPERVARLSDDEIRKAFLTERLTDRDIAREVVIGRNIRDLYDLNDIAGTVGIGEEPSPSQLVDAGIVDQAD